MLIELGEELHESRESRGLSLHAVAQSAKISAAYLHKLEKGVVKSPSPRVLRRLAGVLGVDYLRLMQLAGYLGEDEVADERVRHPAPRPHPLADRELTQDEWREIGAFIQELVARRDKARPDGA